MPQSNDDSSVATQEIGKGEILDILNEETEIIEEGDEPEKAPPKEDVEEDQEDTEEGKKEKIELVEEETEEPSYDENDIDIIAPARRREILAKYPKLFKDFPHLEKAYFRDQQYAEAGVGTPEEAKRLVQTAQYYNQFANRVMNGSTEDVLKTVKNDNPQAFGQIVDNYLTTLKDVDEKAFYHVVGNTIKSTVAAMVTEADRSKNEDLMNAARILHLFVMGSTEWQPPDTFTKQKPPQERQQETQLQHERMQFFQERFNTVQTDLQTRVDGVLKNTIDQNMDPKGSMTDYVKRIAVNEAMENVQRSIGTDTQFRRLLDRLWESAAEQRFSKPSVDKIRSAYLAKAKSLLPAHIKKSRIEALRGLGKRVREESYESSNQTNQTSKRAASAPATLRGNNGKVNASRGKSTLDFLNED